MLLDLVFPKKCIFCRRLLTDAETDLCHSCRTEAPDFSSSKNNIPFVAGWTAVWYYKDSVKHSIHRYKFRRALSYADAYGRFLAMRIQQMEVPYDYITWVPISIWRRFSRGYDQVALLAKAVSKELDAPLLSTLKKKRHNPAQSGIADPAHRKANVLGAYAVRGDADVSGKTILLIDDVITTGATISECAKTLLAAGAKEVYCAAIASAHKNKKK
ncbi:MAG: ComF family protein [Ruminococcaceae bacterium]|nr:ComF family protein [Oscillospiraceae bacterium]